MPFLGVQPSRGLVGTAGIDADAVTSAKIADDQIDSEHYAAGSIDTAHIATNQIDGTLTKDALIADYSDVTITAADLIMYGDATDSNNTKRDTVQGILDLAGGGGLVHLGGVDASSDATIDLESMIDNSKYDVHLVTISGYNGDTNGSGCIMFCSTDNGSNYDTGTVYQMAGHAMDDSSSDGVVADASHSGIEWHLGRTLRADNERNWGANIWCYNLGSTTQDSVFFCNNTISGDAEDDVTMFAQAGAYKTEANDVTALRFDPASGGDIDVGRFDVYGLAKA